MVRTRRASPQRPSAREPFTYRVELVLDGARYVATATWPADEIAGNEPSVALHFMPNLPGLS